MAETRGKKQVAGKGFSAEAGSGSAGPDGLRPEQWAALGRLADLVNGLEQGTTPLAGALTGLLCQGSEVTSRYALPELLVALLDALKSLQDSGLLQKTTRYADYLARSADTLAATGAGLIEEMKGLPLADLRADMVELHRLLDGFRQLRDFAGEHLAGPATGLLAETSRFWQEKRMDEALADLLLTVSHLHRQGAFAKIRQAADYLPALDGIDVDQAMEGLLRLGGASQALAKLPELLNWAGALEEATQRASALSTSGRQAPDGGIHGLYQLLRDKDVQEGLRTLTVLPVVLERIRRQQQAPARQETH